MFFIKIRNYMLKNTFYSQKNSNFANLFTKLAPYSQASIDIDSSSYTFHSTQAAP